MYYSFDLASGFQNTPDDQQSPLLSSDSFQPDARESLRPKSTT